MPSPQHSDQREREAGIFGLNRAPHPQTIFEGEDHHRQGVEDGHRQGKALLEALDDLNCELIVPLCNADNCVGFLSLNDERLSEAYSNDEISALRAEGAV